MNKFKIVLVGSIIFFSTACTEPGETTEIAAATGGVIGAGLGAIIGSQTGDPGSGLVIGAAAGAGTGALVGNSIEYQEKTLRTQDEAIERQEKMIAAQRSELNELRRMNQDTPAFKTRLNNSLSKQDSRASYRPSYYGQKVDGQNSDAQRYNAQVYDGKGQKVQAAIQERSIQTDAVYNNTSKNNPVPQLPADQTSKTGNQAKAYSASLYDGTVTKPVEPAKLKSEDIAKTSLQENDIAGNDITGEGTTGESNSPASINNDSPVNSSSECKQAEEEMNKARLASDTSDKLFHTRRAIRLCPDKPSYHHSLGEVYLTLNRKEDALFEFQEALKYDPSYGPAKVSAGKLAGSQAGGLPKSNKY